MRHFNPPMSFTILLAVCCLLVPAARAYEVAGFDWRPTLSIDETYDSNITYAPHDEISDWITAIAPGLEGVYEGKNSYAKVKGTLHEKIYADNSDFTNFSQDLSVVYNQDLSKFDRISMKDTFLHSDQPSSFDDEFGRQSGRYDFIKNLLGLSYAHDFSEQWNGSVHYDNEYYNPDREDLSTSVQNKVVLQSDYALSTQTIPFLFYQFSNREYEPGGNISRNSIGVGGKHYLTEQLYVNGRVGADFIDPVGSGKDLTKPQYLIGITDEADPTTVYGATFSRLYEDTSYDQQLLNNWRFSLNWGKALVERLQGILTAFTGGGKYEPDGSKEHLNGIGLLFNYEVSKNSLVSLGTAYQVKRSTDDTRDYEKNTVSLTWKIRF